MAIDGAGHMILVGHIFIGLTLQWFGYYLVAFLLGFSYKGVIRGS